MVLIAIACPAAQVEVAANKIIPQVAGDESSRMVADRFISSLNDRNEGALADLLGASFIWGGGDQFGGKDTFVRIFKGNWANRKGWRITSKTVGTAYLVDGLLQNSTPAASAKIVVPLVWLNATEEYESSYVVQGSQKVVHNYPIYLLIQQAKVVRVIFGPSSSTP
jgi:hypothetical protein